MPSNCRMRHNTCDAWSPPSLIKRASHRRVRSLGERCVWRTSGPDDATKTSSHLQPQQGQKKIRINTERTPNFKIRIDIRKCQEQKLQHLQPFQPKRGRHGKAAAKAEKRSKSHEGKTSLKPSMAPSRIITGQSSSEFLGLAQAVQIQKDTCKQIQ